MNYTAIILAAGQGTRMKSKIPKVLHKVTGVPLINHVVNSLKDAEVNKIVTVLGHGADQVREVLDKDINIVYQWEQLGTGHAVMQAREFIRDINGPVLVLCGDTPLLRSETLVKLMEKHQKENAVITVLTAFIDNPTGYGRIVRNEKGVNAIVEEKDAKNEIKKIKEINTGTYCFNSNFLATYLDKLTTDNAQGEYYLTDLIKLAVKDGLKVEGYVLEDIKESLGINNRIQLAEAERIMRLRILEKVMSQGVTILDPYNTYIDSNVKIGQDTIIYPGCILEGNTVIGSDCIVGPGTRIVESKIGDKTVIQNSVVLESQIGSECKIGPFSYIRPQSVISDNVRVGDFVEIKKSKIGKGSKVPHLSYIGDSFIGSSVNIGCGTITCNYDGINKHETKIEDGAFIGSNTNLVAPVSIGKNAVIGAGSTITKDVPEDALGIARERQKNILKWKKGRR